MVDTKNNPNASHYTVVPIRTVTDQEKTIFEPLKLQTFLIELGEQLTLLKNDFNRIQDTFFKGEIPTPNVYGLIIEDIIADTDTDDLGSNHSVRQTQSSDTLSIETNPINTIKDEAEKTKRELEDDIAQTNEEVKRRVEEQRQSIEEKIQQGQTTDTQNQTYLAAKIVELQQEIKKKKDK